MPVEVNVNLKAQKNQHMTFIWLFGNNLNGIAGCKENHFYSLPFGQAEASIY